MTGCSGQRQVSGFPAPAGGKPAYLAAVRRQRVQTIAVCRRPLIVTFAWCRLGMNRRFVRTLE